MTITKTEAVRIRKLIEGVMKSVDDKTASEAVTLLPHMGYLKLMRQPFGTIQVSSNSWIECLNHALTVITIQVLVASLRRIGTMKKVIAWQ